MSENYYKDDNNYCPQCNYDVTASTNRLIQDTCGHKKCRMCLMQEESGCIACLNQRSNQIKYEHVITKANEQHERFIYEPSIDATGAEEVKVITKLENYIPEQHSRYNPILFVNCGEYIEVKDKEQQPLITKLENYIGEQNSRYNPIPFINCAENNEVKDKEQQPLTDEILGKVNVPSNIIKTSDTGRPNLKSKTKRKPLVIPSYIIVSDDSPPKYSCNICSKNFKCRLHIRYHLYCDGSAKPHRCNICGQEFISKSHYEYHLRNHEGSRPYICSVCKKTFNQQGKLKRHMTCHSQDRPFVCTSCGSRFKDSDALRTHNRIHVAEKPYACPQCSKRFSEQAALKIHSVSHSGIKEFMCDECGKSFGLKSSLNVHIQTTHSRIRQFVCQVCPRSFSSKKDLKRHVTIHANLRPFMCSVCNQAFRRRDNFERHMKNTHPDSRLPPTIIEQSESTTNASQLLKLALTREKRRPRTDDECVPIIDGKLPSEEKLLTSVASESSVNAFKPTTSLPLVPECSFQEVPVVNVRTTTPVILHENNSNVPVKTVQVSREQINNGSSMTPPTSHPAYQAVPVINRSNFGPNIRYNTSSIIKMGKSSNSISEPSEPTNCVSTITCTSNLRNNNVPTIVSPIPIPKPVAVINKMERSTPEPAQKSSSPESPPKPTLRFHLSDHHWRKRAMEMLNLKNELKADSLVYDKSLEKVHDSCEERTVSLNSSRSKSPECTEFYSSPKPASPDDYGKYCSKQTIYKIQNLENDGFYREPLLKYTPHHRPRLLIPPRAIYEDQQKESSVYSSSHHNETNRPDNTRLCTLARVAESRPQFQGKNVIVENRTQHVPGRGDNYVLQRKHHNEYDSVAENDSNCKECCSRDEPQFTGNA